MRKLPLIFRAHWQKKEDEIKQLNRHFHTIILDGIEIKGKQLSRILKLVGCHARYFELEDVNVSHPSFKDILNSLKVIEKITIVESSIGERVKKTASSSLKSLESLVMIRSDWKFLDYFSISNSRLKELKIASSDFTDSDRSIFENFLSNQSYLERLALHVRQGDIYKSLGRFEEKNYKFKLKALSVNFKYWGDDSSVDDAFINFLSNQQSSLEDLETYKHLSEKIVEFIMKSLKLKRFIIEADQLPHRPLFYNAIPMNKYLKTLIITGELANFEVARGLLHIYRSVQKLVVSQWCNEVINDILIFIANNLKSLLYLEIPTLTTDTPEISIPSLKTFHIDFVDEVEYWKLFCVNNPSIETLSVKWLTNRNTFNYEVMQTITTPMQQLKHIRFGAYFIPTERIIQMMNLNCKNLQSLEVFAENAGELESNSTMNEVKFKVIYYPPEAVMNVFKEEPTMWAKESNFVLDSESGSDFSDDPDLDDPDDDLDFNSDFDSEANWEFDPGQEPDFDNLFFFLG